MKKRFMLFAMLLFAMTSMYADVSLVEFWQNGYGVTITAPGYSENPHTVYGTWQEGTGVWVYDMADPTSFNSTEADKTTGTLTWKTSPYDIELDGAPMIDWSAYDAALDPLVTKVASCAYSGIKSNIDAKLAPFTTLTDPADGAAVSKKELATKQLWSKAWDVSANWIPRWHKSSIAAVQAGVADDAVYLERLAALYDGVIEATDAIKAAQDLVNNGKIMPDELQNVKDAIKACKDLKDEFMNFENRAGDTDFTDAGTSTKYEDLLALAVKNMNDAVDASKTLEAYVDELLGWLKKEIALAETALTELSDAAFEAFTNVIKNAKDSAQAVYDQYAGDAKFAATATEAEANVKKAALEVRNATVDQVAKATADAEYLGKEYSLEVVPVRLGQMVKDADAKALDWERYDKAIDAANNAVVPSDEDIKKNFKDAIKAVTLAKTAINAEWEEAAWDGTTYPDYTAPRNWSFNNVIWNNAIEQAAEKIEAATALAKSLLPLRDEIKKAQKLLDQEAGEPGRHIVQGYEAKIQKALNDAKDVLTAKKEFDIEDLTLASIKEVEAATDAVKAIMDAHSEEKNDIEAARLVLKGQIVLGDAVLEKAGDIISATAKTKLENALADAKAVFIAGGDNITTLDFSQVAKAADLTRLAYEITEAIVKVQKELDAAYEPETGITWAYDQPLALGTQLFDATDDTQIYPLDWAAYQAALDAFDTEKADASLIFDATTISDIYDKYNDKQTLAKSQWNTVKAFKGTDVAPYAANWQFNQEQWQKGIDVDAIDLNAINNVIAAAKALDAQIKDAEAIAATDILKNNNKISDAIAAAKAAIAAVDFAAIDETSALKLAKAENAIQAAVAANAEETQDVKTAYKHLLEAYNIAAYVRDESGIDGEALNDLKAAIDAVKDMKADLADPNPQYNTVANATKVADAAHKLIKATLDALKKYNASTEDIDISPEEWAYSQPVRLGTTGDWTLTWTAYDEALKELEALSYAAKDDLKTALEAVVTKYNDKKDKAQTQWDGTKAWNTATNNLPKNYQLNQTLWNDQINMDAEEMKTILETAQALNALQNAVTAAKDEMADPSNVLVGDITTAINDAIAEGEVTLSIYSDLHDCDAWTEAMAQSDTQAIKDALNANKEEINDVNAARNILQQAMVVAYDFKKMLENVDGGNQYKDQLQAEIDKCKAVRDAIDAGVYNTTSPKIKNAATVTNLAKNLTDQIVKIKNAYLDDIKAIDVDWVLGTPLRLGEPNVNTPSTAPSDVVTYDLTWSNYDFAVEELKDRNNKAVTDEELKNLVKNGTDGLVDVLLAKKDEAEDQWANVSAWTGTNFDKVNMYQYNQTAWNLKIEDITEQVKRTTALVDAMGKLYEHLVIAKALTEEDILGDYAEALKTAIKKADEKYTTYKKADKLAEATDNDINLVIKQTQNLIQAITANEEEINDVVAAKNLLHEAVDEAEFLQDKVEEPYKTTIGDLITEGKAMLQNIADGKYNTLKAAYTVTELIDKIIENALKAYDEYNKGITPIDVDWVLSTPLRLGEPNVNTPSTDIADAVTYALNWAEYNYALNELKDRSKKAVKDADLKAIADEIKQDCIDLQEKVNEQWANTPAWTGTKFDKVNMWQYNETIWNLDIENLANDMKNSTAMLDAMGKLYDVLVEKEGLAETDVLIDYKDALDKAYTKASEKYAAYATKEKIAQCTPNDIQLVKALTENLRHALDANYEEVNDVESTKPLLRQTIILVEEVAIPHIENGDNGDYLDNLTQAVEDAKAVWKLANGKKYNELHDSYDLTKASRVLVRAYIDNMNAYQKEIRDLKDALAEEIKLANEALKEVNYTNMDSHMVNAETTELINQIAHAEGLVASTAKDESSVEDFNIDIANFKLAKNKLEKARINAYILDLYDLKNYIADANKFNDMFNMKYEDMTDLNNEMATMKTAIEAAEADYDAYVAQNDANRGYPSVSPETEVKTTEAYIESRDKVAATVETLNNAHMTQNLAALDAAIKFIENYIKDEVADPDILDEILGDAETKHTGLKEAIAQAKAAYEQYNPEKDNAEFFNNTKVQDIISDAIEAVIQESCTFVKHNNEQQAANEITRGKLNAKIDEATKYLNGETAVTADGDFTIADEAKVALEQAIADAQAVSDNTKSTSQELTDAITALDNALKLAKVTSENVDLNDAIASAKDAQAALTDQDAKDILQATISKAEVMDKAMKNSDESINIYTTIAPEAVAKMIKALSDATVEAQNYQEGDYLGKALADAAPYKDMIASEYEAAVAAINSTPELKKAMADELKEAIQKAADYVEAYDALADYITDAKEAENPSAKLETATFEAEKTINASENAFTTNAAALTAIINKFVDAKNALETALNNYRWSHVPTHPMLVPAPWKSNNTIAGDKVYLKLAGKYCSTDYETTNSAVDLFAQGTIDVDGTLHFDWKPFSKETDYKIDAVNLSGTGVADRNNWNSYEWSYNEHFNNLVIKAGTIYSSGNGYLKELESYGPFTWDNVWNVSDIQMLDKDEDGQYYGRWYTYEWTETDKGGVYYVPSILSFYDWDSKKTIEEVPVVISQPETDGTYFINANLGEGFDTKTQNFVNGVYTLNGAWHQVQFIDADQFEYHKYAQEAADIYNYDKEGCYRHYTTASLEPLTRDIEAQTNDWAQNAADIQESLANFIADWESIKMEANEDTKDINIAKQQFTYTVYGAKGDVIDAKLIPNTKKWLTKTETKWQLVDVDDLDETVAEKYFQIVECPAVIGEDGTATIKVEFDPATVNVMDWREYQCRLDVIVGGVNYECPGKSSLQQVIVAHNPMMTFPRYRDDAMTLSYVTNYIRNAKPVFDRTQPAISIMKIDMPQEESDIFYFATLSYAGEQFGKVVPFVKSIVPSTVNGEPGDEKLFKVDYIQEIDRTATYTDANDKYMVEQLNKAYGENDINKEKGVIIKIYKSQITFTPEAQAQHLAAVDITISDGIRNDLVVVVNGAQQYIEWTTDIKEAIHQINDAKIDIAENAIHFPTTGGTQTIGIKFDGFEGPCAAKKILSKLETNDGTFKVQFVDSPFGAMSNDLTGTGIIFVDIVCEPSSTKDPHVKTDVVKFKVMNQEIAINLTRTTPKFEYKDAYAIDKKSGLPMLTIEGGENVDDFEKEFDFRVIDLINYYDIDDLDVWVDDDAFKVHEVARVHDGFIEDGATDKDFLATVTVLWRPYCSNKGDETTLHIYNKKTLEHIDVKIYGKAQTHANMMAAFGFDDVETGVEKAQTTALKNGKYVENDQIVIYRNGKKYTTAGQIRK